MKQEGLKQKTQHAKAAILAGIFTASMAAASVHAYFEQQDFFGATSQSGGILTFEDTAPQILTITVDNTSNFSGIITGFVFNVSDTITSATLLSLTDGNGNDISSSWDVAFNVNNNITPGNSTFDVGFNTTNGINGGIYNDGTATNTNNAFPDIATITLQVEAPNPWTFTDVADDTILRTQRTGANGEGSDKITTSTSSGNTSTSSGNTSTSSGNTSTSSGTTTSGTTVSEPGMLILLAIGLLGQAFVFSKRRRFGL